MASARARSSSMAPDGAIKALVGGRNYADSQFNRAVSAKRQPGSSFKPFVYLAALERGLTPDERARGRADQRQGLAAGELFAPIFWPGDADARALALAQHRRGAARRSRSVRKPWSQRRIASASSRSSTPNASIALGTSEVSPLELVSAYAPFANGGIGVQPHVIERSRRRPARLLYQRKGVEQRPRHRCRRTCR